MLGAAAGLAVYARIRRRQLRIVTRRLLVGAQVNHYITYLISIALGRVLHLRLAPSRYRWPADNSRGRTMLSGDHAAAGISRRARLRIPRSSTWWKRACGACRSERVTAGVDSLHRPPIIVPLMFGWARTPIGEAPRGDPSGALIRYGGPAMPVGRQIQINHVEGELTGGGGHAR